MSFADPNLSALLLVLGQLFVVVIELYLIARVELTKTTETSKNFPTRNLWWLTLVGGIIFINNVHHRESLENISKLVHSMEFTTFHHTGMLSLMLMDPRCCRANAGKNAAI